MAHLAAGLVLLVCLIFFPLGSFSEVREPEEPETRNHASSKDQQAASAKTGGGSRRLPSLVHGARCQKKLMRNR